MNYCTLLLLLLLSNLATAATPPKISAANDLVVINDITLNKVTKELSIKASFAITAGIREYFLVGEEGKAYESAFKIKSRTTVSELNFALLLLGAEPVPFQELLAYQDTKEGLSILSKKYPRSLFNIQLKLYGTTLKLSNFLKDRENKHTTLTWVYTGGFFTKNNTYMADNDYCAIGIWPDQSAPLNLFNLGTNPYNGDDAGFELIHPADIAIKVDQPIELIITAVQPSP